MKRLVLGIVQGVASRRMRGTFVGVIANCAVIGLIIGCATASIPVTSIETLEFHDVGIAIDYPAGWEVITEELATRISERASGEGYQITIEHQRVEDLALPSDPKIDDLVAVNFDRFGWLEPIQRSHEKFMRFDAIGVKAQSQDTWSHSIMGFADGVAFLLQIAAPAEQALDEFMPEWIPKIVRSARPIQ